MGWSISLGRIAGTEVRIHLTFLLLVAWYAIVAGMASGQAAALDAFLFILAVFACVLAHEFGHVLMARHFGIPTRDITLFPIGGVASIERMPEKPSQELLIALAGPMVNVVIAALLVGLLGARLDPASLAAVDAGRTDFLTRLAMVNVVLVLFNLLPAFPMDGGRVLRALLTFWLERSQATRIAARIGQVIAFGLGFLGLFGNPMLLFIALFVFLAAGHEAYAVELAAVTKGAATASATITSFATLGTQSLVGEAVRLLIATSQCEFPVTDGAGRLQGVLTRDGMIRALAERGPETPVLDVMLRDIAVVSQRAPLDEAIGKLQLSNQPLVGVVDDAGRVVGIFTRENLAEYVLVEQARQRKAQSSSGRNSPTTAS